jgi:hypothetical protein
VSKRRTKKFKRSGAPRPKVEKKPSMEERLSDLAQIEQRKVSVLIPCEDDMKTAFAVSMFNMIQHTLLNLPGNLESLAIQTYSSSILPWNRHSLVAGALKTGATHTLWIDSDMMFPRDMLLHFLKFDQPLIGINAMSRRPPYRCLAQSAYNVPLPTTEYSCGLEKVYRMGLGVAWIATEVYKKMGPPWFDFQWLEEKKVYRGEDYVFFEKAKKLGYDLYIDHDISKQVWHMGTFGFNPLLHGQANETGELEVPEETEECTNEPSKSAAPA